MNEGFILSNKIRKVVFVDIASGEKRLERIAKKNHLIERAVKNAAEELKEQGLIKESSDGYSLTDDGAKLYAKMKGKEEL